MQKLIHTRDTTDLELDETTIEQAIEYLQSLKEKYSDVWTDLKIFEDPCYEGGYHLKLQGKRFETDLEYENRTRNDKEREMRKLNYDRAEYERLKALFEKDAL
jgi:hypothetical protein